MTLRLDQTVAEMRAAVDACPPEYDRFRVYDRALMCTYRLRDPLSDAELREASRIAKQLALKARPNQSTKDPQ